MMQYNLKLGVSFKSQCNTFKSTNLQLGGCQHVHPLLSELAASSPPPSSLSPSAPFFSQFEHESQQLHVPEADKMIKLYHSNDYLSTSCQANG